MSRTEPKFLVSENTIMWAFRYALGRRTGAVDDVVSTLKDHWKQLEPQTQVQIQEEIKTAIQRGVAGADCDVKCWEKVLEWEVENAQ